MLRSDNSARAARVKALIEQLDTPGRPGGNMFIVYLKNADAARVAQTLRALMIGRQRFAVVLDAAVGDRQHARVGGIAGAGRAGKRPGGQCSPVGGESLHRRRRGRAPSFPAG